MNWLNSLLRKPPPPAPAQPTPRRAAAPVAPPVDIGALRDGLSGSLDDAERGKREAALGRALGASVQAPLAGDSPAVWAAAISHGTDKSIALGWLEQVIGDTTLAQIAADARFAEVRLAAAQRIEDSEALEAVARASKNRDKGVYRHCTDVLRARREAQERAIEAAQIAQALQKLLDHAPISVSHLLEVERSWKALAGTARPAEPGAHRPDETAPHDPFDECRKLLAQANARILQEADAQRALQSLASGHDALAGQIGAADWPQALELDDWRQRRDSLASTLTALPDWLAQGGTAQAIRASLQTIGARLDAWSQDHARFATLDQFLSGLAMGTTPDAETVAAWEALPKPDHAPTRNALLGRWQALSKPAITEVPEPALAAAAEPPAPPPPEPGPQMTGADLDTLRAQLEQLEQALDAGQLAQSDAAAKLLKATQGDHSLESRLDARLQRALLRLGELRSWAQWGASKKREDLIEAAQQLRSGVAAGSHDVEHLTVAIPALREEWKRLNAQGQPAKGQWESFDRALEAAYVPVAAFRAEESERRNQARALREALLTQWDAAMIAIDWEHPEPAAIDALRETMITQWRAAPHAGFRDERLMRTRFDALVHTIDERLDAARTAEIQRRESLIAAVTALADVADGRRATEQAKALQERWRTEAGPLRLRRGEEQKLWQRFRAGCDAVFARRDAERTAQTAQRKERAQARAALLTTFAAILDSLDAPAGNVPSGNAPSGTAAAMDARGSDAPASNAPADDTPGGEAPGGNGDAAAQVSALKRAITQFRADWEASTADSGDAAGATSGQERQARELLQRSQQSLSRLQGLAITARYAALAQSAPSIDGVDAARLETGRAEREEILIDLEIALGLATPGAAAEIRRRRQLAQLQNRFRSGPTPAPRPQDPEKLLAQWYATAAAPDASHAERLAAVVHTLVERQRALLNRNEAEPARRESVGNRPRTNAGRGAPNGGGARPENRTRR